MSLSERIEFLFTVFPRRKEVISTSDFPYSIFSGKEVVKFRQSIEASVQLTKGPLKMTNLLQLPFDVLPQILSCG